MTRGNQREVNRERAQKRAEKNKKKTGGDIDAKKRMERDAELMREKQRRAKERQQQDQTK